MTRQDDHRAACTTLAHLDESANPALGALLQVLRQRMTHPARVSTAG